MSVDNPDVVDIIGIDPAGRVVLTVSDHLDWIEAGPRLLILQDKINRYLAFVESGEILETYPKARGREVLINVVTKYDPPADGLAFFERVRGELSNAGFQFTWS